MRIVVQEIVRKGSKIISAITLYDGTDAKVARFIAYQNTQSYHSVTESRTQDAIIVSLVDRQ